MNELVLNQDTMKVVDRTKAEIGRMYPDEFLSCITDDVRDLLRKRMEEKGVKREIELLDTLVMLERYSIRAEVYHRGLDDSEAADLVDVLANATDLIAKYGGKFYSGTGSTVPRKIDFWEFSEQEK